MFACLYVPDFPVHAVIRSEPPNTQEALRQSPLAVLDGPANLPKAIALNHPARKLGIEIGMTKLQIETCGGVILRKRLLENEDSAQSALIECASSFSPRVESTCPGTVILDLSGTEKLFGSPEEIARRISAHATELGFDLWIAIASNPDTALCAARGFSSVLVISAGQEAQRLASLPIGILPLTPEIQEIFHSWGIHTFKALAALPEISLTERLGQSGLYLQKLAQGRIKRTLVPVEMAPTFVETYEFDEPVEILESLTFLLHRLIQQICDRLISHSLATNELRLILDLEVMQLQDGSTGEQYKREWKLPVSTQDKNTLFAVVRLDLENITLTSPVRKVTMEAIPVKPRMVQGDLFAPPSPEAEKLEITLARIRGVVGSTDAGGISCVGSPSIVDTHLPDAFLVRSFSSATNTPANRPIRSILVPRIFRPALETSVELTGDKPHFVRLWKTHRRVLAAFGPWCSSGNWWNCATAWVHEEWDVILKTVEGFGYYRIYQDRIKNQWFVEAVFD